MQLDLLEREPEVSQHQLSSSDSKPERSPTIGEKFAKLWEDYQTSVDTWVAERARLAAAERVILPAEGYMLAFKAYDSHEVKNQKAKVAADVRQRIKWHAEKEFAPPGGRLSIDDNDIRDAFPADRDTVDDFDPAAFWSYLDNKYGGNTGQNIAWQQIASAVVSAFWLRDSKGMEMKGGYAILSRNICIDDISKKYRGVCKLSYSSEQTISECCNALCGFAAWAERHELRSDINEFRSHFTFHGSNIQSRKKFECGDKGEIVVVTFNSCFEFRIREDVAAQLNLFLGTYLPNGA